MKLRILHVCLLFVALLGFSLAAVAQSPSAFPYAKPVPNDTATGTTQFTLTKINSSGNAVIMSSTDVNGFSGVCVSNCGTSGTAWIVFAGLVPIKVENTATVNHYVTIGSTTGGDGHDTGATSYPSSGAVIGRVQTGASSGTTAMVDVFGPEIVASSPAAPTITVANAGTTGTTSNTLTKLTGAPSTAVIATTTDTKGVVGIVTSGAGTSGNAVIQIAGTVNCVFDGSTTADDYVQISSTTGGDCHDSGPNFPTSGQAIGRILSTNGSAGTYNMVLFPAEIQAAGTLTAHSISVPLACADTSGSGTAQSCTTSPSITPVADDCFFYTTTTPNSGTGLTTNIDALGAKSIAIPGSSGWTTTLTAGIIPANKPLLMCYDGTNLDVAQTGTSASGGSSPGTNIYTSAHTLGTADNGALVIMNCPTACAVTAPATQPSTTFQCWIMTIGTANATITLGGSDTFNLTTTVPVLNKWKAMPIWANSSTSTDYEGDAPILLTASSGLNASPVAYGYQMFASVQGNSGSVASRNTSLGSTTNFTFSGALNSSSGSLVFDAWDSVIGVGCSTSTTIAWVITYVDVTGTTQTVNETETIAAATGNGVVGGDKLDVVIPIAGQTNNSTGITISNTYTLGSGCSTHPSYQASFKLIS